MAHETLKTLITQNIKTNGRNAITAQILQDVLIAMVDDYPDISGYATRTWVQQQDFAPKDWVENKHYATQDWANQKFENYLSLAGGTMQGTIVCGELASGYYMLNNEELAFSIGIAANYLMFVKIGFEENEPIIKFAARNGQLIGTEITRTNVTSDAFVKRNGTAAQFLKADGSVDGNTYITASALTDYAAKSWVTSQLGSYATQSWVTTQLGGYLPLTGGTLTGDLFTALHKIISITLSEGARRNTYINLGYQQVDGVEYAMNMNVSSSLVPLAGLDLNGVFLGSGYKVTDGTSDEVLCADGSTKTLAELKAALNAI